MFFAAAQVSFSQLLKSVFRSWNGATQILFHDPDSQLIIHFISHGVVEETALFLFTGPSQGISQEGSGVLRVASLHAQVPVEPMAMTTYRQTAMTTLPG